MPDLIRLQRLPWFDLQELVAESQAQGFQFLQRLVAEYASGANRFDRRGEALFGIYEGQRIIAIGGLTLDPYTAQARVGRVRHLYVASGYRRQGFGKWLVEAIIAEAYHHFERLTLRTDTEEAANFYCALGFERVANSATATHYLQLLNSTQKQENL